MPLLCISSRNDIQKHSSLLLRRVWLPVRLWWGVQSRRRHIAVSHRIRPTQKYKSYSGLLSLRKNQDFPLIRLTIFLLERCLQPHATSLQYCMWKHQRRCSDIAILWNITYWARLAKDIQPHPLIIIICSNHVKEKQDSLQFNITRIMEKSSKRDHLVRCQKLLDKHSSLFCSSSFCKKRNNPQVHLDAHLYHCGFLK